MRVGKKMYVFERYTVDHIISPMLDEGEVSRAALLLGRHMGATETASCFRKVIVSDACYSALPWICSKPYPFFHKRGLNNQWIYGIRDCESKNLICSHERGVDISHL
jgi:hypothetical protein